MSESSVLTLDIGGDSGDAVEAVNAVAEAMDVLKESASGVSSSGEAAAEGIGAVAEPAQESFDSVADLTGGLGALSGIAGSLGMGEVAESLRSVGEAGKLAGEGAEEGGVGMAGFLGIAAAGVGAVAALGGAAANEANEMMKISAVMQTSEEDAHKWSIAMEMAGGSSQTLVRAVDMVGQAAAKNGPEFQKLGVDITQADGSMRSAGAIFEDTIAKIANLSSATERHNEVISIFGTRLGGTLIPLIEHYSEIMPKAAEASERASKALDPEAAIKYNAAMANLEVEVTNMGAKALPLLVGAAELADTALRAIGEAASIVAAPFQALDGASDGTASKLWAVGAAAGIAGGATGPLGAIVVGAAVAYEEFKPQIDGVAESLHGSASALGSAAGEAAGFAMQEEAVKSATGTLNAMLEQQVNALGLSKYGFEASAAGAEAGAQSLAEYTVLLGDATQAQIAFANAQGQTVNYGSGGSITYSSVPTRAAGGPVSAGTIYRVNEMGMEYFRPNTDGQVIPMGEEPGGRGGGAGISVTYNVNLNGPVYGMADFRGQVGSAVRDIAASQSWLRGYLATA